MRTKASDGELLGRYAAEGAEECFRELVLRHGPMVLAACRRLVGEDAEDASQAVFLLLAQKAGSLAGERDAGPWLFRAAGFVASRVRREQSRRGKREKEAATMRASVTTANDSAEAEIVRRELCRSLDAAVAGLPAASRQAVVLCYLEGLSQAQAAQRLGIPLGTVADRCARGLAQLRERLGKRGVMLGAAALSAALTEGAAHAAEDFAASSLLPSILAASYGAAGGSAAGATGKAVVWAKGAAKMMFWTKMKVAALVVVTVTAAGGGFGVVAYRVIAGEAPNPPEKKEKQPEKAAEAGESAWGETVNGLRLGIKVEPKTWHAGDKVVLTCMAENVSDKPLRILDWRAARDGLILADQQGKPIEKGGGSNASRELIASDFQLLEPHKTTQFVIQGTFNKGTFIYSLLQGPWVQWPLRHNESLAPGVYVLTARMTNSLGWVKEFNDLWSGPEALSASTRVSVESEDIAALIAKLASKDGVERAAATKRLFELDKTITLPALEKAGAKEIATIASPRINVVYSLVKGLEKGSYTSDGLGVHVENGATKEDLIAMGQKYGFTLVSPFNAAASPNAYVQLQKDKPLAEVMKALLSDEPKIVTVNLNYVER